MDLAVPTVVRAGIALGSNLGDRTANLRSARGLLQKMATEHLGCRQAPIYCSPPVNCPANSPDFFNTVVEISYQGTPTQLLEKTQAIESQLGRLRNTAPNSPRIIDLDILYLGNWIMDSPALTIPHPRITQRRFVLQPLADIHPSMTLPGDTVSIREHLRSLDPDEDKLRLVETTW